MGKAETALAGGYKSWARAATRLACAVLLGACLAPRASASDTIYLHKDSKGRRTFSDYKMRTQEYTFIGEYGRPTATKSCRGLTPQLLKTRERQYETLIETHAKTYGLDANLVKAVMRVESCFDPKAVSSVGARGLMQLMPETAALMGVGNSFDPDQNIRGGVRYLDMMLDRFDGNQDLALAAYNAGPGAVTRHKGIPPFRETKDYVRRVSAHYRNYRAPATGLTAGAP